jgi:hypothetical protein
MSRSLLIAVMVASALSLGANAAAQDVQDDDARLQFEQGKSFFNEGKFEQAAIALERAYQLRPSYRILYYVGLAETENGNYVRALEAYKKFVSEAPADEVEPGRIDEVKREITRLEAMVGQLAIKCEQEGAKVKVDAETKGTTPLTEPIRVNVGRHEVVVKKDGRELLREVIRIAGGQTIELVVEQHARPAAPVAAAPTPPPKPPADSPPQGEEEEKVEEGAGVEEGAEKSGRVWTWVAYGVGLAAGIGAGVTGAMALKGKGDVESECDVNPGGEGDEACLIGPEGYAGFDDDKSRVQTLALVTDVLIGVAVAGAITGTVLFFVEPDGEEAASVSFQPTVSPNLAGLAVTGRF